MAFDSRPSTSHRVDVPTHRKPLKMTRSDVDRLEGDHVVSNPPPSSSDAADPQIQTNYVPPAPTPEGDQDNDQHPDDPLETHGSGPIAQPIPTSESYQPWFGSVTNPGILPLYHSPFLFSSS